MSTEIQSRVAVFQGPGNQMMYRHFFFREGQDQRIVKGLDRSYRSEGSETPNADRRDSFRDAISSARAAELRKMQQNAFIRQFNERIVWVLSETSGQWLPADAEACWKWWNDVNEVYVTGEKELVGVIETQDYRIRSQIAKDCPEMGRGGHRRSN